MAMPTNGKQLKAIMALDDYISGMSLQDIAAKYKVSVEVAEMWSERGKWNERRAVAFVEMQAAVFMRYQELFFSSIENSLAAAGAVAKRCNELIQAYEKEVNAAASGDRPAVFDELSGKYSNALRFLSEAVRVQKSCMPQATKKLSELFFEQLRRQGAVFPPSDGAAGGEELDDLGAALQAEIEGLQ